MQQEMPGREAVKQAGEVERDLFAVARQMQAVGFCLAGVFLVGTVVKEVLRERGEAELQVLDVVHGRRVRFGGRHALFRRVYGISMRASDYTYS